MASGMVMLRLIVGRSPATHGSQKLFAFFGGAGSPARGSSSRSLVFVRRS